MWNSTTKQLILNKNKYSKNAPCPLLRDNRFA